MDEAKQSGDFSKNANYKRSPAGDALIARRTSRLCSMIFPTSLADSPGRQRRWCSPRTTPRRQQNNRSVTVQQGTQEGARPTANVPGVELKPEPKQARIPPRVKRTRPSQGEGYEEFDSEPVLPTPPAQPQATPTDDGVKPTRKMLTAL